MGKPLKKPEEIKKPEDKVLESTEEKKKIKDKVEKRIYIGPTIAGIFSGTIF